MRVFRCVLASLYEGLSVRPSVRPSVRDALVKIAENGVMQDGDASYVVYTALFKFFFIFGKKEFQNEVTK